MVNNQIEQEYLKRLLRIGILLCYVVSLEAKVSEVVPLFDQTPEVSDYEKSAAVSVGLMRHYKHNNMEVIPSILEYNQSYQFDSFEELRYWIGICIRVILPLLSSRKPLYPIHIAVLRI